MKEETWEKTPPEDFREDLGEVFQVCLISEKPAYSKHSNDFRTKKNFKNKVRALNKKMLPNEKKNRFINLPLKEWKMIVM